MLKLYTWATQNARKISIMLNECDFEYQIIPVDIEQGEQHFETYLQLNPNAKIPVLTDTELLNRSKKEEPIFETGAILLYLAEKSGCFLPTNASDRISTIKWLFWQTSNLGPVFGNFSHFASALAKDKSVLNNYLAQTRASEPNQYAIERFSKESFRLLGVLERVLSERDYIAHEDISIADFACYPWIESVWQGLSLLNPNINTDLSGVYQWMNRMAARSGVKKGMAQLAWGVDLSKGG